MVFERNLLNPAFNRVQRVRPSSARGFLEAEAGLLAMGGSEDDWEYPLTPSNRQLARLAYESDDDVFTRLLLRAEAAELDRIRAQVQNEEVMRSYPAQSSHATGSNPGNQRSVEAEASNMFRGNEAHLHYMDVYSVGSSGESDSEFPVSPPMEAGKAKRPNLVAKAEKAETKQEAKDINTEDKAKVEDEDIPPTFRWVHIEIV